MTDTDVNMEQGPVLTPESADAVAAICLMAAFADGQKDSDEQKQLENVFNSLGEVNAGSLYSRVMLGRTDVQKEAAALTTPELRTLAFEMALSVCDADGSMSEAEGVFLGQLQEALTVPAAAAMTAQRDAEQLAEMPVETSGDVEVEVTPETGSKAAEGALEQTILNAAILNGALELLPQSLATIAIVPLQLRLVYTIGQTHGYTLDRAHLKEFLGVAGVGMTSQVVEGHVRKLFGTFAKKSFGRGSKKIASAAAGATLTFATTYALGQAAKMYYGGGRKLELSEVRTLFQEQVERGQQLFDTYQGDVQTKAKTTDVQSLLKLIR